MPIEEALQLIKTILYTNTGKKLTVIEKEIIKAAWQNETYATIANSSHLSIGHIKDVAYKLWKQLSKVLGEKINKTNLQLVLEKKAISPCQLNIPREIYKTLTNANFDSKKHISQLQQEINELKHIKEILYQSRAFLESILNSSPNGIALMQAVRDSNTSEITDFKFLMANPVIAELFYSYHEDLIGNHLLKSNILKDNPHLFNYLIQVVETQKPLYQELYFKVNNIKNWYQIMAVSLGESISLTICNITQRKLLEIELIHQASIDSLTNIANRCYFEKYLAQQWQSYKHKRLPISLILCEINDFESEQNIYNKQSIEQYLINIALSIANCIKHPTSLVGHYRENQFAIILPNTDTNTAFNIAELIQREFKKLNIPHVPKQSSGYLTVNLGIANMIPTNNEKAEALIMAAETMLSGHWV